MSTASVPSALGLLERDAQQPIVARREVLLGDGRTQHVAQQRLAATGVLRPGPGGPMQCEPIERLAVGVREADAAPHLLDVLGGMESSASKKGQPSCSASSRPTVVLPEPATPMTMTTIAGV
jgi:hypothetical protein